MEANALAQDAGNPVAAVGPEQASAIRILSEERERQSAEHAAIADRVDRSLRQATDRLAQATNVRGVIIDMLRESSTIVDAQGVIECGLLLYDSVSRLLRFEAMFANGVETDLKGTPLQGPFSVDSESLKLPWLRIQREPWLWGLTDDASILATTARAYHESKGTRSVAYLPLRRGQDCIGFVGFSLTSAHPPTPQQVELLKSVGSQVALAVEVQRLATANEQASAARERQRLADLRSIELTKANVALQATIDAVTHMQSLDDFMPRVVAIVAEAFEAVGAGYFEHPGETIYHRFWLEDGQLLAAAELPDLDPVHLPVLELLTRGFSVPPEHLGVEFRQRLRPSIVHHRVATASPAMHALSVSRGWDWELNIPLFANDRTDAAITFFRHEDQPFTEADLSLAESLAKQISLARQVSRVGEREREIAVARERAVELARANQVMSRVNDLMSSEINPESALNHVLRELTTLVGADAAALYEYRPNERQLRFKVGFERGVITNHLLGHPFGHPGSPGSVDDFPAWPTLVRDRRQLFVEIGTDQTIPPSNAWHVANGHKMLALSALLVGGQPVGLLGLAFMEDTPLSDSRREMFGALAQQMTLALQLVGLADQARVSAVSTERAAATLARSRELERASTALQATIDAVSKLASLEAFIPQALRIVVDAFGAESAAYWEHTSDSIYLRHWLVDGQVFGPTELPGLDHGAYGLLARLARGFTVSSDHLGVDFRNRTLPALIHHRSATASPELHSFAQSMGWDWELNVPLLVAGVADGALTLYRSDADPFTEGDFSLAEALAKQISLAMKISRVAEREREITVARERETIAEQRALELARSNEALQSTIDVLASVDSLAEFVPSVLRVVSTAFESAGCAYYEHLASSPIFLRYWLWKGEILGPEELRQVSCDDDRGFLRVLAQGFQLPVSYTKNRARHGHTPVVMDHGKPVDDELDIDRFYRAQGLVLELRVPLIVGGSLDGALVIRRSASQPFNESEIALAGNLGKQLSLATHSHRLAERARIDSLTRAQEQAVVRERERMSRDIHDTLAQGYAAILVNSQALKLSLRSELSPPVLSGIEMFERLAKENLNHARRTMEDLRADPFGRAALTITLQQCASEETTPGKFSVELDIPTVELWVPRYVEVELRRIVKEALNNARRHARTGVAMLALSIGERRCTIRIIDQGVGFDSEQVAGSYGIRGMRERAGRAGADLAIETSPGHGTIIAIMFDMEISGDGPQR